MARRRINRRPAGRASRKASDGMVRKRNSRAQHKLGLPPDVQAGQRISRTVRWLNVGTSTAFPLTAQDLYDMFWFATSTTSGVRLYDGLRIKNIRLYCPPPATGLSTVTLSFPASSSGSNVGGISESFSITSGMSTPGKWSGPPPVGSIASFWLDPFGAQTLFSVGAGGTGVSLLGAMIDISLECVNDFQGAQTSVVSSIAGATTGLIYTRSLDFPALGSLFWEPQGNVNHL